MKSAEAILLQIQKEQQDHDVLAHQDILNLDTHTRIKHMTLHFLKYAGKTALAARANDRAALEATVVDVFIICLATANTLNVSLGAEMTEYGNDLDCLAANFVRSSQGDAFSTTLFDLVTVSGKMAKAIESTDHLERGNPRAELEALIVELTRTMLGAASRLELRLEDSIKRRWRSVEGKSIFRKVVTS